MLNCTDSYTTPGTCLILNDANGSEGDEMTLREYCEKAREITDKIDGKTGEELSCLVRQLNELAAKYLWSDE